MLLTYEDLLLHANHKLSCSLIDDGARIALICNNCDSIVCSAEKPKDITEPLYVLSRNLHPPLEGRGYATKPTTLKQLLKHHKVLSERDAQAIKILDPGDSVFIGQLGCWDLFVERTGVKQTIRHVFVSWSDGLGEQDIKDKWTWVGFVVCAGAGLLGFEDEEAYGRYLKRLGVSPKPVVSETGFCENP